MAEIGPGFRVELLRLANSRASIRDGRKLFASEMQRGVPKEEIMRIVCRLRRSG